jgi:hypothetical protein
MSAAENASAKATVGPRNSPRRAPLRKIFTLSLCPRCQGARAEAVFIQKLQVVEFKKIARSSRKAVSRQLETKVSLAQTDRMVSSPSG